MVVTVAGSVTELSDEQPRNAYLLMAFTAEPIVSVISFEQLENA
jgi:hypothetical protein